MHLYHELAEYYFSIEKINRNFTNDIALIRSLLNGSNQPSLLDLGCGTGEHMNALSKYGIRCLGIDISEEMLKVAKERFPINMQLLKGDMRDLDYYNEFDIVISLFGSFNYLIENDDIDKTLWNTWRSLKQSGSALFEIWNSFPVEKISHKDLTHISTINYNGKIINRNRGFSLLDQPGRTVVEVDYEYTISDSGHHETVYDRHIMRTFSLPEIVGFIENNGFRICNIYSDSVKNTFRPQSNRMLIHFQKI